MAVTYRTSSVGGGTTGTGNRTATISALAGDLLVVYVKWSGNNNTSPTCSDNGAGGGGYDLVGTALNNGSADIQAVFIRQNLVQANATLTISPVVGSGNNTAGEIAIIALSGALRTGIDAVRGFGKQENQTTGVPTAVLPQAALTTNLTITSCGSTTTAGSVPNASWTERQDASQSSPVTCIEVATRNSGFTGTSAAYVSVASSVWSSTILEIDGSALPINADIADDESANVSDNVLPKMPYRAAYSDNASADLSDDSVVLLRMMASTSDNASLGLSDLLASFLVQPVAYDAVVALLRDRAQVSDSFAPDDSGVTARLVYLGSLSDTYSGIADALTALMRDLGQASDSMGGGMGDALAALFKYRAGTSDDVGSGLSDSVLALFKYRASLSESLGLSDAASLALALLQSMTESSIPISDSTIAILRDLAVLSDDFSSGLADLVISDLVQLAGATPIYADIFDDVSVGLSDSLTALLRHLVIASEVLSYTDLMGALERHLAASSDDAGSGMSDVASALYKFFAALSDSFSPVDNTAALLRFLAVATDALGMSDLTSAIGVARGAMTDDSSAGMSDLAVVLQKHLASIGEDAATLSDNASALMRMLGSFSDSLTFSESVNLTAPLLSLISDTLGLTDLASALMVFRGTLSDNQAQNWSDNLTALMRMLVTFSDAVPANDAVSALSRFIANPSDALVVSDLIGALEVYNGQFSENNGANLTELVYALEVYLASISDSVPYSDLAVMTAPLFGSMSDVFVSSDAVLALMRMLALPSDSFSASDLAVALGVSRAGISDDAGTSLADLASALMPHLALISDSVPTTDVGTALLRLLAASSDSVIPQDAVGALARNLASISDDGGLSFSDNLLGRLVLRAVIGDDVSLGFADLVEFSFGTFQLKFSIADDASLGLVDSLTALLRLQYTLSEQIDISDFVSALQSLRMTLSDSFGPADSLSSVAPVLVNPSESFGLSDELLARFVHRALLSDDEGSLLSDLVVVSLLISGAQILQFTFAEDQGANVSDALMVLNRLLARLEDGLTYGDLAYQVTGMLATMTDGVGLDDLVNVVKGLLGSISDTTEGEDAVKALESLLVGLGDNVSPSDLVSMVGSILVNPSEVVGLYDTLVAHLGVVDAQLMIHVINTLVRMLPYAIHSVIPLGIPYATKVVGLEFTTRTVSLVPAVPDETEVVSLSPQRTIKEIKE